MYLCNQKGEGGSEDKEGSSDRRTGLGFVQACPSTFNASVPSSNPPTYMCAGRHEAYHAAVLELKTTVRFLNVLAREQLQFISITEGHQISEESPNPNRYTGDISFLWVDTSLY